MVMLCREISALNVLRHGAEVAHHDKCVTDAGWAKVVETYVEHTNLTSLHRWCGVFSGLLGVYFVGGVYTIIWGTRKLG